MLSEAVPSFEFTAQLLPLHTPAQVWDRRTMDGSGRRSRSAGVFVGHSEGVTHLDSKVSYMSVGTSICFWQMA